MSGQACAGCCEDWEGPRQGQAARFTKAGCRACGACGGEGVQAYLHSAQPSALTAPSKGFPLPVRCRCAAYYEWEPSIAKCVSTCKPGYVKQAAILYCSVPCSNPGFPVERDPFTCASTDGTATKSRAWMKRLVGNFSGSTLATAPRATAALRPCARGEGLWTCHASECQATCMLAKGLPAPAQPWAPHPRVDSSLAACRHQPDHCEWRAGLLPVLGAADPGPGPPDQSGPLQQPGVPINLRCLLAPGVNQEHSWCQGMLLISQALVLS